MPHATLSAPETRGHTLHWAGLYDVGFALMTGGRERTFRARIADLAALQPGERVLDVGCGTGGLAIAAAGRVGPTGRVHGVDASPEMVARGRHHATRAGLSIVLEVAPVEALPFPDRTFDVVLSSLMLHHLPEDVRGLAFVEIRRVLCPGGRLLAVDFESPRSRIARALTRLALSTRMADYDVRTCLPLMRAAGFVEVDSGPTPYGWLTAVRGRVPRAHPDHDCAAVSCRGRRSSSRPFWTPRAYPGPPDPVRHLRSKAVTSTQAGDVVHSLELVPWDRAGSVKVNVDP